MRHSNPGIFASPLILLLFYLFMAVSLPKNAYAGQAISIHDLFAALKKSPTTIEDRLKVDKALTFKKIAWSKLAPSIDLFARYNYSTAPTGMVPLPPNDLLAMVKDPSVAQPFSQNIFRLGASFSMPLFVKPIYSTISKASKMAASATAKMLIDEQKNEAMIVGLNANLQYMDALEHALDQKFHSLLKTKEIIEIKVKSQRIPQSALLKIESGLNDVALMKTNIALNRSKAIEKIASLTGKHIDGPVQMTQTGTYKNGTYAPLIPLMKKIDADSKSIDVEKDKLYPKLIFMGNYNHSMAESYNNDTGVNEDYAFIGIALQVPLFTMEQYERISLAKIEYESTQNKLAKVKQELDAQAMQLETNLSILEKQVSLYQSSVEKKRELLKIAKASYDANRMTIEDYLKYEDDLVMETAKLFKTKAEKLQALMQLAVIYGNQIEDIVK